MTSNWPLMNGDDEQVMRDITRFAGRLLEYAGWLPPDLAAMLRGYESALGTCSPGRWEGIGSPGRHDDLAQRIGQAVTDGEWPAGTVLDCGLGKWYCWGQTLQNAEQALRFLAVRGELDLRHGTYYVRARDEGP